MGGSGYQRRTRLYMIPFVPNRSCDVRLYDKQDCYMQEPSCDAYSSFSNSNGVDEYEISSNQLLQDSRQDDDINGNLPDYSNNIDIAPPEICSVPKDSGICRSNLERWYFDIQSGYCKDFGYTGCGGNKNNFPTKENANKLVARIPTKLVPIINPIIGATTMLKFKRNGQIGDKWKPSILSIIFKTPSLLMLLKI